jgi:hypothetical protein
MTLGYFSLIQWCPDRPRNERVNVGIVFLVPGRKVHVAFSSKAMLPFMYPVMGMYPDRYPAAQAQLEQHLLTVAPQVAHLNAAFEIEREPFVIDPLQSTVYGDAGDAVASLVARLVDPAGRIPW